jgi:predicted ATPase/class 3 adenylate cyclase
MSFEILSAYVPSDRRHALVQGRVIPDRATGAVLFADIAGFTRLTRALAEQLGPRRGADALIYHLNNVYDLLITQVERYGGSVVSFSGDAITCWFDNEPVGVGSEGQGAADERRRSTDRRPTTDNRQPTTLRAVACALAMQREIQSQASIALPNGAQLTLALKVAIAAGPVRRFLIGAPAIQRLDVLAGATLDRIAAADYLAQQGEVVVDQEAFALLREHVTVSAWRNDHAGSASVGVIDKLITAVSPTPHAPPLDTLDATVLRRWLIPAVADRLQAGLGEFLTDLRPATVLFARFTGIEYDADNAGAQLDTYIRWVQSILMRYDGALIQVTIGDKGSYFFAAFGAPIAHEDDSRRAVLAALAFRTPPPQIAAVVSTTQIGLSQGLVRAGAYGSATRRTYGVQGDAVNMAARLMQHAAPGDVLADTALADAISSEFEWEEQPPFTVKGNREPTPIARLIGLRAQPTSAAYTDQLIGRDQELAQLRQALRPLASSRFSGVINITGEAGIGKSHLAAALCKALSPSTQWFACPTDSVFRSALHPFRALLRRYFDQHTARSNAHNKAQFDAVLDRLIVALRRDERRRTKDEGRAGGEGRRTADEGRRTEDEGRRTEDEGRRTANEGRTTDNEGRGPGDDGQPTTDNRRRTTDELADELDRTRSFLGALIDVYWEGSLYEHVEPKLRFENTLQALKTFILAESRRRPLIVHLEDAHWLDDASHALVQMLTRDVEEYPFAVLLTSRPRDDGQVTHAPHTHTTPQHTLEVGALSREAVRAYAARVLGETLSDDLTDFLLLKTGGNPLFIEQLALDLRERGWINIAETQDSAERPMYTFAPFITAATQQPTLEMPATVNSVLVARLDRLDAPLKVVVQTASVLGVDFETPVLAHVLRDDLDLPVKIQRAADEDIWRAQSALRYLFSHVLLREAAYGMQAHERLRSLHALAAQAIETEHGDHLIPYYPILAHHYHQAEDAARERHFAKLAGEQAAAQYANDEALAYFSRALELTPEEDAETRFELLQARERVYNTQGKRAEQQADLDALEMLAEHLNDDRRRIEVTLYKAGYAYLTGDFQRAQTLYEVNIPLCRTIGDLGLESRIYKGLGTIAHAQTDFETAHTYLEQSLALARTTANKKLEGSILSNLGAVCNEQGMYASARRHLEQSLAIVRMLGEHRLEALALNNLAVNASEQGEPTSARAYLTQSLAIAQKIGARENQFFILHNLGGVALDHGDYSNARSYTEQSVSIARAISYRAGEAFALSSLGRIAYGESDFVAAKACYEQGLSLARSAEYTMGESWTLRGLGHTLIKLGDVDGAITAYTQSLELSKKYATHVGVVETLSGLARAVLIRGNIVEANAYVTDILAYLETNALDGAESPALVYLACYQVLQAANDPRANELLAQGYRFLMDRAAKISDEALRRSFLEYVPWNRELLAVWGERVTR